MRDRILELLRQKGHPVPADQVLSEALGVRSPNTATADKVLKAILRNDPHFKNSAGNWSLREAPKVNPPRPLAHAAILYVEQAEGTRDPLLIRGALIIPQTGFTSSFGPPAERGSLTVSSRVRRAVQGRVLVCWSKGHVRLWRRILSRERLQEWDGDTLELRAFAERLLGQGRAVREAADLAPILGLAAPETGNPLSMARYLAACWRSLLDQTPEESRRDATTLREWIEAARPKVDFSRFGFGAASLRNLPESPGVYIMKNRADDIVYVGKSRNLKRRIKSYFTPAALRDPKVRRIHEQLHTFEMVVTANEVEALLLEMRMIRDFRPPINLQEEIHEQPEAYGRKWNCLLLVPDPNQVTADVYFLRDGSFVAQASARLGQPAAKRLSSRVKSLYFNRRKRPPKAQEFWETEIVSRWLSANRGRMNFVDVDEAGSCESVIRRLSDYLQDRDRLAGKVLYR
jgi:predicted GIY-YIG superfamily endonuclease